MSTEPHSAHLMSRHNAIESMSMDFMLRDQSRVANDANTYCNFATS